LVLASQINKFGICREILEKDNLEALLANGKAATITGIEARLNSLANDIRQDRSQDKQSISNSLTLLSAQIRSCFDGFHFQNIKTQI
jgi:archaellum component FlaC